MSEAPATAPAVTPTAPPTTPLIGGLYEHTTNKWTAWTGGQPNHNWDNLDLVARGQYKNPNQFRYQDPSYDSKGYNRRAIASETKFEKGDDLRTFKLDVTKHFVKHGMDSITYLNDPENSTEMISVIDNHARFTVETARNKSAIFVNKFDKYDDSNNEAALEYLLGSLGPTLLQSVRDDLEPTDPFTVVWLIIIKNIQSTSIDTYQDMKNQIRALKPSHYEGQNIQLLTREFRRIADQLVSAGHYDHTLTLVMLESLLTAGGVGNQTYTLPLLILQMELNKGLLKIPFMSKEDAHRFLATEGLLYKDVCRIAVEHYELQANRNKWPPAMNNPNNKAPPSGFGAHTAIMETSVKSIVANVLQQLTKDGANVAPKAVVCYECNKPGHYARNCPQKKPRGTGGAGANDRFNRRRPEGGGSSKKGRPGAVNWRKTPPLEGQSQTKTVTGQDYKWCDKCKRWTTTHGTAQHTGTARTQVSSTIASNLVMIDDPSAWIADFDSPVTYTDLFRSIFPLFLMSIGLCTITDWWFPNLSTSIVEYLLLLDTFLVALLAQN